MSTPQRNDARVVAVDPSTADILRHQTLIVLEANHHYYEDILLFGPEAQHALSVIYRDAFAVLDAIGWRRPDTPPPSVDVRLTVGLVQQLRARRCDLGHTNIDRLDASVAAGATATVAEIEAAIRADRIAAQALDQLTADRGVGESR
ncbi:MAG: hypothetical protein JWR63_3753 [Conexibacter sp.]|nr:hypothetical protein [Conexibacter sp.]